MFEHRMYLPLAAVVTLVVLAGYRLTRRATERLGPAAVWHRRLKYLRPLAVTTAVLVLGSLTIARNADYRSARTLFAHDCAVRPLYWRAHLSLSLALQAEGDLPGTEAELDRAVSLMPDRAGLWFRRGALREELGKSAEALDDFNMAIRLAPRDADSYYNRGLLLFRAGQYAPSMSDCLRAIELAPGHFQAYALLQKAQAAWQAQQAMQAGQDDAANPVKATAPDESAPGAP